LFIPENKGDDYDVCACLGEAIAPGVYYVAIALRSRNRSRGD
jgi:hypothetical protein